MKITVNTGFGYYKNALNQIIGKAELPKGQHDLADGLVYVEVANKAALDAISIYVDSEQVKLSADKALIAATIEKLAIAEVKKTSTFESTIYKAKL